MEIIAGMLANLEKKNLNLKLSEPAVILSHLAVPLIIIKFVNGLSLDIQFPKTSWQALRNTHLIRNYVLVNLFLTFKL